MATIVQSALGGTYSASLTVSANVSIATSGGGFASPTTAGNTLVCIPWTSVVCSTGEVNNILYNYTPVTSTPTTSGLTWAGTSTIDFVDLSSATKGGAVSIFYIFNAPSIATSVTTVANAAVLHQNTGLYNMNQSFALYEISGLTSQTASVVLGNTAVANLQSGAASTPTVTKLVSSPSCCLAGMVAYQNGGVAAGTGFTLGINTTLAANAASSEYLLNRTVGSTAISFANTQTFWALVTTNFGNAAAANFSYSFPSLIL